MTPEPNQHQHVGWRIPPGGAIYFRVDLSDKSRRKYRLAKPGSACSVVDDPDSESERQRREGIEDAGAFLETGLLVGVGVICLLAAGMILRAIAHFWPRLDVKARESIGQLAEFALGGLLALAVICTVGWLAGQVVTRWRMRR